MRKRDISCRNCESCTNCSQHIVTQPVGLAEMFTRTRCERVHFITRIRLVVNILPVQLHQIECRILVKKFHFSHRRIDDSSLWKSDRLMPFDAIQFTSVFWTLFFCFDDGKKLSSFHLVFPSFDRRFDLDLSLISFRYIRISFLIALRCSHACECVRFVFE